VISRWNCEMWADADPGFAIADTSGRRAPDVACDSFKHMYTCTFSAKVLDGTQVNHPDPENFALLILRLPMARQVRCLHSLSIGR
jgi:hypothetical protein